MIPIVPARGRRRRRTPAPRRSAGAGARSPSRRSRPRRRRRCRRMSITLGVAVVVAAAAVFVATAHLRASSPRVRRGGRGSCPGQFGSWSAPHAELAAHEGGTYEGGTPGRPLRRTVNAVPRRRTAVPWRQRRRRRTALPRRRRQTERWTQVPRLRTCTSRLGTLPARRHQGVTPSWTFATLTVPARSCTCTATQRPRTIAPR